MSDPNEFTDLIESEKRSFLFLFKSGIKINDCAFSHLKEVIYKTNYNVFVADVSEVRDINNRYNISTVPSLLEFESWLLKNMVKGCQEKAYYSTIFKNAVSIEKTTSSKNIKQVIVYTTSTCTICNAIKTVYQDRGLFTGKSIYHAMNERHKRWFAGAATGSYSDSN